MNESSTTRCLYFARSGNSLRAAIALELSGVEAERVCLDMSAGEHKASAFLALNPVGTVPVFVEERGDGPAFVLTQSAAIADYVLRHSRPDLYPVEPRSAALVQSSTLSAVSDISVQNALSRYLSFSPEASRFVQARFLAILRASLDGLMKQPFVCGNRMTVADIAHFPVVYMRRPMLAAAGEFAHVLEWIDRMMQMPAVLRAVEYAGIELPFGEKHDA